MNLFLLRTVALLLIPCLLADPAIASAWTSAPSHSPILQRNLLRDPMPEQALTLALGYVLASYGPTVASRLRREAALLWNARTNFTLDLDQGAVLYGVYMLLVGLTALPVLMGVHFVKKFKKAPAKVISYEQFLSMRRMRQNRAGFLLFEPVLWMGAVSAGMVGGLLGWAGAALGVAFVLFFPFLMGIAHTGGDEFKSLTSDQLKEIARILRNRFAENEKQNEPFQGNPFVQTRQQIKDLIDVLEKPSPIWIEGEPYRFEILFSPHEHALVQDGKELPTFVEKNESSDVAGQGLIRVYVGRYHFNNLVRELFRSLMLPQDPFIPLDQHADRVKIVETLLGIPPPPQAPKKISEENLNDRNTRELTMKQLKLISDGRAPVRMVDPSNPSDRWMIRQEMAMMAVALGWAVGLTSGDALVWIKDARMFTVQRQQSRSFYVKDTIALRAHRHQWTLRSLNKKSMRLTQSYAEDPEREIGVIHVNSHYPIGLHGFAPPGEPKLFNLQVLSRGEAGFEVIIAATASQFVDVSWTLDRSQGKTPRTKIQEGREKETVSRPNTDQGMWKDIVVPSGQKEKITPFERILIKIFNHRFVILREGKQFFIQHTALGVDGASESVEEEIVPNTGWSTVGKAGSKLRVPYVRSVLFNVRIHWASDGRQIFEIYNTSSENITVEVTLPRNRRTGETTEFSWVPFLFPALLALNELSKAMGWISGGDEQGAFLAAGMMAFGAPRLPSDLRAEQKRKIFQAIQDGYSTDELAVLYDMDVNVIDRLVSQRSFRTVPQRKGNPGRGYHSPIDWSLLKKLRDQGLRVQQIAEQMGKAVGKVFKPGYIQTRLKQLTKHEEQKKQWGMVTIGGLSPDNSFAQWTLGVLIAWEIIHLLAVQHKMQQSSTPLPDLRVLKAAA